MTMHERNLELVRDLAKRIATGALQTQEEFERYVNDVARLEFCKINRVPITSKFADKLVEAAAELWQDCERYACRYRTSVQFEADALRSHPWSKDARPLDEEIANAIGTIRLLWNARKRIVKRNGGEFEYMN